MAYTTNPGKEFGKKVIGATLIAIVTIAVFVCAYVLMELRVDYHTLDYLIKNQKSAYSFNDLGNDIDVHSINDIGYMVKGKYHLEIHYGRQVIDMNSKCFKDEDFFIKLKKIGLEVKWHENDDGSVLYRVTSWGTEVEEWTLIQ